MDGRWVLLTLVVAVVAAIRWRRRAPSESEDDRPDDGRPRPPSPNGADGRSPADVPPASSLRGGSPRDGSSRDGASFDGSPLDGSLHDALERVWAEHAHDAETLLYARLHQLVQRGVPVRAIRRAPGNQVVRVVFADNTVVLCQGTGTGDFGRLGLAMHRSAVRLGRYVHEEDGTRLEFRWNPDQRLAAVAVGLDQPD